jgi:hypothetical protein
MFSPGCSNLCQYTQVGGAGRLPKDRFEGWSLHANRSIPPPCPARPLPRASTHRKTRSTQRIRVLAYGSIGKLTYPKLGRLNVPAAASVAYNPQRVLPFNVEVET